MAAPPLFLKESESMSAPGSLRSPPMQTVETRPFWEAASRGELLFGRCGSCEEKHYYPRARCPYCFSDRVEWQAASGRGHVYSYSVVRRSDPPYVTAYVTLVEGVTVFTNIVDCDIDRLSIGQPVMIGFEFCSDGQRVAVFRPANLDAESQSSAG